nr:DUF3883 domain-containing protein [uncultured Cohaesibacter sp.]
MAEEKLLYINVAWMTYYMGPNGDKAEGNFGYMKENPGAVVHESWNFKPINGKVYGYVPRSARIDIANLGATLEDQLIENVTVVWISRDPRVKKTVIVGWYRNATIHRRADHIRKKRNQYISVGYQIEAPEEHTVLLSTDARVFKIPTGNKKGSLGQSPIWYGSNQAFNRDVLRYIKNGGLKPKSKPNSSNPELRRLVEQAAINHAIAHFSSPDGGARDVVSVEKDGVGWDLEARDQNDEVLKIEVKGLSGHELKVELTPNEYEKMCSKEHRKDYVIYVLLDALSDQPIARIFRFDAILSKRKDLVWTNVGGQRLKIEPRVGARLTI